MKRKVKINFEIVSIWCSVSLCRCVLICISNTENYDEVDLHGLEVGSIFRPMNNFYIGCGALQGSSLRLRHVHGQYVYNCTSPAETTHNYNSSLKSFIQRYYALDRFSIMKFSLSFCWSDSVYAKRIHRIMTSLSCSNKKQINLLSSAPLMNRWPRMEQLML